MKTKKEILSDCFGELGDTERELTSTPEEEQEPPLCHWCNGTGENRWGTGACRDCRGLGVERPKRK